MGNQTPLSHFGARSYCKTIKVTIFHALSLHLGKVCVLMLLTKQTIVQLIPKLGVKRNSGSNGLKNSKLQ